MQRWQIGDVQISCIFERDLDGLLNTVLPDATPQAVAPLRWLFPYYVDETGLRGYTQAFVVKTPTRTIMVDTCIGNDKNFDAFRPSWSRLQTRFLDELTKAGYARNDIDTVLCTHLHSDHIGWNTMRVDGRWVPTFPNARYLFGRVEYEAERARNRNTALTDARSRGLRIVAEESIAPIMEAGLADLVEVDHVVCDEVRLVSTPGHTAGHVSVEITSRGARALITGDFVHHPCQLAHPEWGSHVDFDVPQSTATRRKMFNAMAGTSALLIGSHFAEPSGARIVQDGDTWRLEI
jgi:glyoxylase-like metal-dependent hydrolase (beta-lactamase superfamily II)